MVLPCNVTVEASDDGGSIVRILDPKIMMGVGMFSNNPALNDVAAQAHRKLSDVAKKLSE
jgi:hypothetical protein